MTTTARGANVAGAAIVLAVLSALTAASPHQVVLPSTFGVVPQPLPAPANTVFYRSGLDLDVPVGPVLLPSAPVLPDHVTPVLRTGSPAILLLPQTPSSGVYHLSDTQHQFPPFLENVVNRVQNLFSSYVQVDPFNVPFATRPPTAPPLPASPAPSAAPIAAPSDGNESTAAITTTTTTTTHARTGGGGGRGRGINLRLLSPGTSGTSGSAPDGLRSVPRDVELLQYRQQQQQQQQQVAVGGSGRPVAFASATAQVLQPGAHNEVDNYSNTNKADVAIDQKPPPPSSGRPPSKPSSPRPGDDRRYGYGGRGSSWGPKGQKPHGGPVSFHGGQRPGPAETSYYRRQ